MALTEHEKTFVQKQDALDFSSYLKSVWHVWPTLNYNQVRRKASKLWKARRDWLKKLEPIVRLNICDTCHSTFHEIWAPCVPLGKAVLTVTQWDPISYTEFQEPLEQQRDVPCWGCKENQPNQLAHMNYGGCLYDPYEMGLVEPFEDISALPLLPASPPSTD